MHISMGQDYEGVFPSLCYVFLYCLGLGRVRTEINHSWKLGKNSLFFLSEKSQKLRSYKMSWRPCEKGEGARSTESQLHLGFSSVLSTRRRRRGWCYLREVRSPAEAPGSHVPDTSPTRGFSLFPSLLREGQGERIWGLANFSWQASQCVKNFRERAHTVISLLK